MCSKSTRCLVPCHGGQWPQATSTQQCTSSQVAVVHQFTDAAAILSVVENLCTAHEMPLLAWAAHTASSPNSAAQSCSSTCSQHEYMNLAPVVADLPERHTSNFVQGVESYHPTLPWALAATTAHKPNSAVSTFSATICSQTCWLQMTLTPCVDGSAQDATPSKGWMAAWSPKMQAQQLLPAALEFAVK